MTKPQHFSYCVIGGGSAGYAAARTYREHDDSVAIVDGGAELGGLCILRGCMPSKTLIYIAEILHHARHGSTFGLEIPQARPDMSAVHDRKKRIIAEFAGYRTDQLQDDRFTLFRQRARFIDETTIELTDGQRITAGHFIISTGSMIQVPPVPGLSETPFITSDDVLDLDHLPESIMVLGGGIVACELAQYLNRMGSRVIQIQRSPRVLKEASPEASEVVMEVFRREGIDLLAGTKITAIEHSADGVRATFLHDGETRTREAAVLFNALGRTPATADLGLESAGVAILPSGHIAVDAHQRTANPRIYAAGDCTGPHEIVHVAIMQGEVAAHHALGLGPEPVDYESLTSVIFTDPQVAAAGMSPEQAAEQGIDLVVAEFPFDDHGKSILMEAKDGYVKCWAERATGRLVRAECVGKDAGELIHAMAVAVHLRADVRDLLKAHWYHPTLSEIWTYPLEDCAEEIG